MSLITVKQSQKSTLRVLILVALIFGFIFLQKYMLLIIFSGVMATLFNPVHQWLLRKGKTVGTASFYTFMISMLVIIIPVALIGILTFFQINRLVDLIANGDYSVNVTDLTNSLVNAFNNFMQSIGVSFRISTAELANDLSAALTEFGKSLFNDIIGAFSNVFAFITTAIIYIYVFLSMLKNQDKILKTIKRLNPLGDEVSELYISRVNAMTKATVRGQFIIAFMQGFASAAVLSLVGLNNLFFFFLMLLTLFSVIPLGAGIITIPIGIIMILTGNVWQGATVILNHLLIVTNIDNIMRPRLVPKSARLDPALMILAVFSGLAMFGFLGIVIGPLIMILIVTTVQIYMEVFHKVESIDRSKQKEKQSFFSKLKAKL